MVTLVGMLEHNGRGTVSTSNTTYGAPYLISVYCMNPNNIMQLNNRLLHANIIYLLVIFCIRSHLSSITSTFLYLKSPREMHIKVLMFQQKSAYNVMFSF